MTNRDALSSPDNPLKGGQRCHAVGNDCAAIQWASFTGGATFSYVAFRTLASLAFLIILALFPTDGYCSDSSQTRTPEPATESTGAVTKEDVTDAVQHAVDKVSQEAVKKTVEQAAEKAAEKAVQKTVDKVTEHAMKQVVEKAAQKAVEKTVEKAAEHAVNQVAEKAAQKAVEQATAEAKAQAQQTAMRPEQFWGATKVNFLIFVIDIDSIDDANQNFTANIYMRLRWVDRRLASPGAPVRQMPLDSVWNPRVTLVNLTGIVTKSLPDVVQIESDGAVTYHQRYTGKLSQPLRLSAFPRDRHTFTIQFAAAGYPDDQLEFVPDVWPGDPSIHGGAMAKELSIPDWNILGYEASSMTYSPIRVAHSAGFGLSFEAERYLEYYLWQMMLPLVVVVLMAAAAFWFRREDVGVRIGIATSSVLTMIANRFVLSSQLPRLPYMTRMDYLSVGSTLLVFLALFLVVVIVVLEKRQRVRLAHIVDTWSRGTIPAALLVMLVWFIYL